MVNRNHDCMGKYKNLYENDKMTGGKKANHKRKSVVLRTYSLLRKKSCTQHDEYSIGKTGTASKEHCVNARAYHNHYFFLPSHFLHTL